MPICEECSEDFDPPAAAEPIDPGFYGDDIERFYRAIAEGADTLALLDMAFSLFGEAYELSPPETQMRVVNLIKGRA